MTQARGGMKVNWHFQNDSSIHGSPRNLALEPDDLAKVIGRGRSTSELAIKGLKQNKTRIRLHPGGHKINFDASFIKEAKAEM